MTEEARKPHKRLSGWWALISIAVGFAVAIAVGQVTSDGAAEIAGIMVASFVLCVRAFWDFSVKRWFLPMVCAWACIHACIFVFLVLPLQLHSSKGFISLIWLEFFAFVGVIWLASKLWGGPPEETQA